MIDIHEEIRTQTGSRRGPHWDQEGEGRPPARTEAPEGAAPADAWSRTSSVQNSEQMISVSKAPSWWCFVMAAPAKGSELPPKHPQPCSDPSTALSASQGLVGHRGAALFPQGPGEEQRLRPGRGQPAAWRSPLTARSFKRPDVPAACCLRALRRLRS